MLQGHAVTPAERAGKPVDDRVQAHRWARWIRQTLAEAEDTGYFGPESAIWRVNRELVLGLGLNRALLMQFAHPWVAQGVTDFSSYFHNPVGRLLDTTAAAELLVFGSRAQADAVAAHIRHLHTHVNGYLTEDVGRWKRGTRYSAEDPDALLWVLVTVADTALVLYEAIFGSPGADVEAAYLADAARLGAMLGVIPAHAPRTRAELDAYVDRMIAEGSVAVGRTGLALARTIIEMPLPTTFGPALAWYRQTSVAVTARFLPAALYPDFAPLLARHDRPLYRTIGRVGRVALRHTPPSLRMDPIAAVAVRRAQDGRRAA